MTAPNTDLLALADKIDATEMYWRERNERVEITPSESDMMSTALRTAATHEAEVARLIDELRADEGHSVEILCLNPDFNGQPDQAIEVTAFWPMSGGQTLQRRRFAAGTLVECLRSAREALSHKGSA